MKAINNILLIGICGRSRSGKDSVVQRIASVNKNVLHINMDAFFKDGTACTYNGHDCWEHTDVIHFDRLYKVVSELQHSRSTVIEDRSLWYGPYDCKISTDDLLRISVVIVQGYTLFTLQKLTTLFDSRVYIEVSNKNILHRRPGKYTEQVVIPVSMAYSYQSTDADKSFDSNTCKVEVIADDLVTYINTQLKMNNRDDLLELPSSHSTWVVSPGDLLSDHEWHSIDFMDMKDWVQLRKHELNSGETLEGNTFEYRRNFNTGNYEIRLSPAFEKYRHLCRYTRMETLKKQ